MSDSARCPLFPLYRSPSRSTVTSWIWCSSSSRSSGEQLSSAPLSIHSLWTADVLHFKWQQLPSMFMCVCVMQCVWTMLMKHQGCSVVHQPLLWRSTAAHWLEQESAHTCSSCCLVLFPHIFHIRVLTLTKGHKQETQRSKWNCSEMWMSCHIQPCGAKS